MRIIRQKLFAKYEGVINGVKQTFKNKKAFNKAVRESKFGKDFYGDVKDEKSLNKYIKRKIGREVYKDNPSRVNDAINFNVHAKEMLKGTADEGKGVYGLAGQYKKRVEELSNNPNLTGQETYDLLKTAANKGDKAASDAVYYANIKGKTTKREMLGDYQSNYFENKFSKYKHYDDDPINHPGGYDVRSIPGLNRFGTISSKIK